MKNRTLLNYGKILIMLSLVAYSCQSSQSSDAIVEKFVIKRTNNWVLSEEISGNTFENCDCSEGNSRQKAGLLEKVTFTNDTASRKIVIGYDPNLIADNASLLLKIADCSNTMAVTSLPASDVTVSKVTGAAPVSAEFAYASTSLASEDPVLILQSISEPTLDMQKVMAQVSQDTLRYHVDKFFGVRNRLYTESLKNLKDAKTYLKEYFAAKGMQTYTQTGTYPDYEAHNIIGRKVGLDPNKVIIVGAHFDTNRDSPGADDNASGLAGMLEIVRILSEMQFEHTLVFVGMDLEEEGHLGSTAFVNDGGISSEDEVIGYINIDMIGYYSEEPESQLVPFKFEQRFPEVTKVVKANGSKGDFVISIANTHSADLAKSFEDAVSTHLPSLKAHTLMVNGKGESFPELRSGDHSSFWDADIQSISIGDGANARNFNYHSPEDKVEHLNFDFMSDVTKVTLATVVELAKPRVIVRECKSLDAKPLVAQK